jgi:hypothetical protein
MPRPNGELQRLKRLARSKLARRPGLLILPHLALRIPRAPQIEYALRYFRAKTCAPFASPYAQEYEFVVETPFEVKVPTRSGPDLVAAVENELSNVALYLSTYLTHPRYGEEQQVGFVRGDTLRPSRLRPLGDGRYGFRVTGLAVGRRDMLSFFRRPNLAGPRPPAELRPPLAGWSRLFFLMPTRPDAREVDRTEWYEFTPSRWARMHPGIPLRPPLPVLIRPRGQVSKVSPQYDKLYRDGTVRIALLFGYDERTHFSAQNAREMLEILTARPGRRFTVSDTGPYGYHGPGLGFSDPTGGNVRRLNFNGTSVFQRNAAAGAGPVAVRYPLVTEKLLVGTPQAPEGSVFVRDRRVRAGVTLHPGTVVTRTVNAEVRLFDFDKAAPDQTAEDLVLRFVSVFGDNDLIHYDGHANYGGGFYIGDQPDDILWAEDVGDHSAAFSRDYQIFSIGACHSAGYFADLFYNELRPRKSPRNLDVIAAVNENAFEDSVHVGLELVRALLQHKIPLTQDPPDYTRILTQLARPSSFHAYTGVFGRGG